MTNCYNLCGRHCKVITNKNKIQFPLTGGVLVAPSASVHSTGDCLNVYGVV